MSQARVTFGGGKQGTLKAASGPKWLRIARTAAQRVGEHITLSLEVGDRRYQLDALVVEVTREDMLLFITKSSAGWTALAAAAP